MNTLFSFLLLGLFSLSPLTVHARGGNLLQTLLPTTSCKTLTEMGLTTGVSSYWKYSGTGSIANGASISSTTGVAGTVTNTDGAGMSYVPGVLDQGIKFGGDDLINYGSSTVSSNSTLYSVSLWVKPGVASGSNALFFRGSAGDCHYNPYISLHAATKLLSVNESGCGGTGAIGGVTITDKWTHVAVTRNGQTVKVFVDGVLKITDTSQPAVSVSGQGRVVVGASWHHTTPAYFGFTDSSIDEVVVWTTELSDTQVATLYNGQNCY